MCFLSVREGCRTREQSCKALYNLKPVTRSPRGKYNTYTQERAQIGKYATDNGATKAATHFLKLLDSKIGESNVSIVELSDKKTFTCSAALHVVHLGLRNTPMLLPKLIEDYVIAFAVHNRQI